MTLTQQQTSYPRWDVDFDAAGKNQTTPEMLNDLKTALPGFSEVFIFSHGWNNDLPTAEKLYTDFFDQLAQVAGHLPQGARIGTIGIIWPSMRWPDETRPVRAGAAASMSVPLDDAALVEELKRVYFDPTQQQAIDVLASLLKTRPKSQAELQRFNNQMRVLMPPAAAAHEDNGEADGLFGVDPVKLFQRFAAIAPRQRTQGAAGLGDVFSGLWDGAKEALRVTTYWTMKQRAGIVGEKGLGPLLAELRNAAPKIRLHLIGHSFGARLVSYALKGFPDVASKPAADSVMLLQGAFSHFAFADELPVDANRSGALAGMSARVAGPILVTHSLKDTAVGTAYPLASFVSRDDAAALEDQFYRWGAMGHDGAQASGAKSVFLGPVGTRYDVKDVAFLNLDANQVIVKGGPPSGAHSDIIHPEIAWALLTGARVK